MASESEFGNVDAAMDDSSLKSLVLGIQWFVLLAGFIIFVGVASTDHLDWIRSTGLVALLLTVGLSNWLVGKNPRWSMMVLVLGLWAVITSTALLLAGVHSVNMIIYPFLLSMTGWVLGRRWLFGLTVPSVFLVAILAYAEGNGSFVPTARASPVVAAAQITAVIFVVGFLTLAAQRHLVRARDQAIGLSKELELLAQTDLLTELPNRRYFMTLAELEVNRANRYGTPLSICMLDIDHFKAINDTFGHGAGDLVLQSFSRVSRQMLRETDLLGRVGGEEFAVLMPQTELEQAKDAAERIRLAVEAMTADDGNGLEVRCTVSIGVATWSKSVGSLSELLKHADLALYDAKRAGRNRVCARQVN